MMERGAYCQTLGDVFQLARAPAFVTRSLQKSKTAVAENASDETPVVHIVDDDDSVRHGLDSLLRSVGLSVRTYPSTQEFLSSDRLGSPGCIVLDIRLPERMGWTSRKSLPGSG
jgi:PleD family two-component response regulator